MSLQLREKVPLHWAWLKSKLAVAYTRPRFRCGVAGVAIVGAGLLAHQAYDTYQMAVKRHGQASEEAAWFDKAKPALNFPGRAAPLPASDSLLSVITEEAKSHGVGIERADYQGEQLVVSFMEAEFETMMVLLGQLERERHLLSEHIVISAGSGPGLCRVRAALRRQG